MKAKRGVICPLAALAVLLAVVVVMAQWDTAKAAGYNPTMECSVSDPTAGANSDVVRVFNVAAGDYNYKKTVDFLAAEFGMNEDLPQGAWVADLDSNATLGLLNYLCITSLPVTFHLFSATVDKSNTVTFTDSIGDLDGNGVIDGVEKYPDFLDLVFPGLTPTIRLFGIAAVAGTPVTMNIVVFEPGTSVFGLTSNASLGRVIVNVLNNPAARLAPNAITDFCTPLMAETTLFGVTKTDGTITPVAGGTPFMTNPTTAGDYTCKSWGVNRLDADGDGLENYIDTCPYDVNSGVDTDKDGIDAACDPNDDVNENSGDYDNDVFANRGDLCPLVANGPNQADNQTDTDGDDIGDACDQDPTTADGEAIERWNSSTVTIVPAGTWINYTSRAEVTAIVDDGNDLWVGSYGGLTTLDKTTGEMTHYNAANSGLPDNMISDIARDVNGDWWIGTDNGLAKFDGTNWTVYTSANSPLPRDDITCLAIDADGVKWIGVFMGGLFRYDGVDWTVYNTGNSGLPNDDFRSIAIDEDGNKWLGTNGGGLAKFDGMNWTVYNPSNSGLPGVSVSSIAFDANGHLWAGLCGWSYDNGLAKFDGNNWTVYNTGNSPLPSNCVRSVAIDMSENKWIGTYKGFARFDGTNWTLYDAASLLGYTDEDVYSVTVDAGGTVWVGYYRGLVRFDGLDWTTYDTGNSPLPDNYVTSVRIDQYGNKWLGTFWGGLVKFDGTNWTIYDTQNSDIPNNGAWIHAIDNDGSIWMSVWNSKSLVKFDGTSWTVYDAGNSGLPDGYVTSVAIDTDDNKWIGVYDYGTGSGALVRFDGTDWTVYDTTNSGLPNEHIPGIAIDTNGNVWLEASPLVKFDGTNWTVYDTSNSGLPSDHVSGIAADANGNVWVASSPYWDGSQTVGGGLVKFDGTNWTVYDTSNSELPSNYLYNLTIGKDGNIWEIAYGWGPESLVRFDGTDWTIFNLRNSGLPNRRIESLAIDEHGGAWVATWGGLGGFFPATGALGDTQCDNDVDAVDCLYILQNVVGMRACSDQCPPPAGTLYCPAADTQCDKDIDAVDALFCLQYVVGMRLSLQCSQ